MTAAQVTAKALDMMRALGRSIEDDLKGRTVRVLSDHNGQPYGRSRRSWKGELRRVVGVHVDIYDGVELRLEGHEWECYIPADEVELP